MCHGIPSGWQHFVNPIGLSQTWLLFIYLLTQPYALHHPSIMVWQLSQGDTLYGGRLHVTDEASSTKETIQPISFVSVFRLIMSIVCDVVGNIHSQHHKTRSIELHK